MFKGRRTAFDPHFSRQSGQAMVDSHRPGDAVPVYYRPGDPETCVLEPGGGSTTSLAVLVALIDLIIAPLAAFMTWFMVVLLRPARTRAELRRREKARARAH